MDRVIALFKDPASAERARTQLVTQGLATDRVDVVSQQHRGRVVHLSDQTFGEDLSAYFHVLLNEEHEWKLVEEISEAIVNGNGALVVHPRGQVEIDMMRPIVEGLEPETVFWRVAPEEAQGGVLGEYAAGFKSLQAGPSTNKD